MAIATPSPKKNSKNESKPPASPENWEREQPLDVSPGTPALPPKDSGLSLPEAPDELGKQRVARSSGESRITDADSAALDEIADSLTSQPGPAEQLIVDENLTLPEDDEELGGANTEVPFATPVEQPVPPEPPMSRYGIVAESSQQPSELHEHVSAGTLPASVADGFGRDNFISEARDLQTSTLENGGVKHLIPNRYLSDTSEANSFRQRALAMQGELAAGERLPEVATRALELAKKGDYGGLIALKVLGARCVQSFSPDGDSAKWQNMNSDQQHSLRYGQMMIALAEKYSVDAMEEAGQLDFSAAQAKRMELLEPYRNIADFPEEIMSKLKEGVIVPETAAEQGQRLAKKDSLVSKAINSFAQVDTVDETNAGRMPLKAVGDTLKNWWGKLFPPRPEPAPPMATEVVDAEVVDQIAEGSVKVPAGLHDDLEKRLVKFADQLPMADAFLASEYPDDDQREEIGANLARWYAVRQVIGRGEVDLEAMSLSELNNLNDQLDAGEDLMNEVDLVEDNKLIENSWLAFLEIMGLRSGPAAKTTIDKNDRRVAKMLKKAIKSKRDSSSAGTAA